MKKALEPKCRASFVDLRSPNLIGGVSSLQWFQNVFCFALFSSLLLLLLLHCYRMEALVPRSSAHGHGRRSGHPDAVRGVLPGRVHCTRRPQPRSHAPCTRNCRGRARGVLGELHELCVRDAARGLHCCAPGNLFGIVDWGSSVWHCKAVPIL